eukprot:scaffold195_cov359-Prasinococcus_capsulatus_cf.AAC.7
MSAENARTAQAGEGLGTVYCICGGTRGDQQPVVMIAAGLKQMGYDIVLCVGPEGRSWVRSTDVRLALG